MTVATDEGATPTERIESLLAAGDEPEAPEEQEAESTSEPEQGSSEEVEEAEESADAEEASEESEDDDPTEPEPEEGEALEVSDLAQYLGIDESKLDVDEDGSLYVKTKVDGEENRATLADLVKSYQLEGHLNKRNMEVTELQKSLEEQKQQAEQQASERLQQLDDALNIAWQQLTSEYQQIDWQSLREQDPAEYAAKRAEYQERQSHLQQQYQKVQQERSQQSEQQKQQYQQALQEEQKKLSEAIPEWQDESVAKREKQDIARYASENLGFSQQEVGNLADHRAVVALRKAMLYDKLQSSKPETMKRVKKAAPKVSKPGAPKSKKDREAESLKSLRRNVKSSKGQGGSVSEYLLNSGIV